MTFYKNKNIGKVKIQDTVTSSLAKITFSNPSSNSLLITVVYHRVGDCPYDRWAADDSKMHDTYVCETWQVSGGTNNRSSGPVVIYSMSSHSPYCTKQSWFNMKSITISACTNLFHHHWPSSSRFNTKVTDQLHTLDPIPPLLFFNCREKRQHRVIESK